MAENITLKIFTPERTALNRKVYRVVLPYGNTNLTIVEDRAPTSLVLHDGAMHILNADDSIADTYFLDDGVVDVADNVCKISTRHIIHRSKISLERARQLLEEEPQNESYYQAIINYLENFD
ncbi:MAG: hypothetical protein IKN71_00225 [Alphaproteobacteria bacterium]|nr:hypothetical protein [Alphaproteobacteria bacterium]